MCTYVSVWWWWWVSVLINHMKSNRYILLSSCHKWGNWILESFGNSPKVTEPLCGTPETWTQDNQIPGLLCPTTSDIFGPPAPNSVSISLLLSGLLVSCGYVTNLAREILNLLQDSRKCVCFLNGDNHSSCPFFFFPPV